MHMSTSKTALRRLAAVALAASLSAPGASMSQPPASPEARAQALANDASTELERGNVQRAIDLFSEADRLYPAPTLKVAIAQAYVGQGKLLEAQKLLLEAAAQRPGPADRPHWPRVRAEAAASAAALTPRLAIVEIAVKGLPAGNIPSVTLDGLPISAARLAMPRAVNPGAHRVVVSAEGHRPAEESFTVSEGQTRKVTLTLAPVAPIAPVATAPSATPAGPDAGARALPPPAPPPRAAAPSAEPRPASPLLLPHATTSAPPGRRGSWVTPVGIGTTAAFGAVGIVTGLLALSKAQGLKDTCPAKETCPASAQSDIDASRTLGTISTVGFALSGAGAALTLYGLLSGRGEEDRVGRGSSLHVGLGPASASIGGRF
jgi:hypothetical protein